MSTKDEILKCAAPLILARGYGGVSIVDLSSAVQIKKSSFYHYFLSKESFLHSLITAAISENNIALMFKLAIEFIHNPKMEQFFERLDYSLRTHLPHIKMPYLKLKDLMKRNDGY